MFQSSRISEMLRRVHENSSVFPPLIVLFAGVALDWLFRVPQGAVYWILPAGIVAGLSLIVWEGLSTQRLANAHDAIWAFGAALSTAFVILDPAATHDPNESYACTVVVAVALILSVVLWRSGRRLSATGMSMIWALEVWILLANAGSGGYGQGLFVRWVK